MKKMFVFVLVLVSVRCIFASIPSTPTGVTGSWSSNHPKIQWSAVSDTDSVYYQVWKKDGTASWALRASTSDTSYIDVSEYKWTKFNSLVTIYYKVRSVNSDTVSAYSSFVSFNCNAPISDKEIIISSETFTALPLEYRLYSAYPNPFNPSTILQFDLPERAIFSLKIYDIRGNEVWRLNNKNKNIYNPGSYKVCWNGLNHQGQSVPSGVYLVVFNSSDYNYTQKINLIK